MLLDDEKTKGVVYVNKTTYDQALMLYSRFDGNPQRVIDVLKSKKTEAYIATIGLPQLITEMSQSMPQPLNMLAPFLMFCVQNQGMTWDKDNIELAYGILHQYSQLIDFNAMTLVPAEVRANVSFPTALLMQYQTSWDDLCSTLKDNVVSMPSTVSQSVAPVAPVVAPVPAPTPVQQVAQPVTPAPVQSSTPAPAPAPAASEDDGLTDVERKILALRQRKEKEHAEMLKKEKEQEQKKPAPAPVQPKAAVSASEAAAANAVLDDYNF